ncbi:phenylalanine--tRNA ligase subunit alpha [Pajaroellobacter abortibovis]|uniref:Phenylalanine--tRNA ligase alpha subunit n=1 Tax=Pajaroellobacter abortibovis TaxID=1882918 RepID=A0A1L6MZM2_9BACT|nr:phenylalanine--tRNA ligase subunit alpha [Pajaroellobacter abortibovis]
MRDRCLSQFRQAETEQALRQEYAKILGRKGNLTELLKTIRNAVPEERKSIGEAINALRKEVESHFQACLQSIVLHQREVQLRTPLVDLSLPPRIPVPCGHKHPLNLVSEEIVDIFRCLGFAVCDGPEVEHADNNFKKLGFPDDHPAIDMQDSFWTTQGFLLRTHTTNVQARVMSTQKPPMAFIAPGAVYRRDDDPTHSPMFHQIDGFLVDRRVSFAEMKGVLTEFIRGFYGPSTPMRFRTSYFPFVKPGAEVDIGCIFCKRREFPTTNPCSVCKQTGWIEVLGCGMIHPTVFEHCGLDPEAWTGFAFGMGIERLAMIRYAIPSIRLFYENDPRFLSQF